MTISANFIRFLVLMSRISSWTLPLPSRNTTASPKLTLVNSESPMSTISMIQLSLLPTSTLGKDTLKLFTERSSDAETSTDTTTTSKLLLALTGKDSSLCPNLVPRSIGREPSNHPERPMSSGLLPATADCLLSYYFLYFSNKKSAIIRQMKLLL